MYLGITPGGSSHGLLHSGKVVVVDYNGRATKISSKMGEFEIIEHHPRDIPSEFGISNPTYIFNNIIFESRKYYRKK